MPPVTINYLAVLGAAVLSMGIGMIWYSPVLFGKQWMNLMGFHSKTKEELQKMQKSAGPAYLGTFIANLVMAYVMAHFVDYTVATTFVAGLLTGFWAWLGFVVTSSLGSMLFGKKPFKLWLIDNGHQLVIMLAAGALLAVWS